MLRSTKYVQCYQTGIKVDSVPTWLKYSVYSIYCTSVKRLYWSKNLCLIEIQIGISWFFRGLYWSMCGKNLTVQITRWVHKLYGFSSEHSVGTPDTRFLTLIVRGSSWQHYCKQQLHFRPRCIFKSLLQYTDINFSTTSPFPQYHNSIYNN
jgi:hypothetical protein